MKNKSVKTVLYVLGMLVALYVTGLRAISFLMEYGTQTLQTDTVKHLLYFTAPDFISLIFCFSYVLIFIRKIISTIKTQ